MVEISYSYFGTMHGLKKNIYPKNLQGLPERTPQKVQFHANGSHDQVLAPVAYSVELTNCCNHAHHVHVVETKTSWLTNGSYTYVLNYKAKAHSFDTAQQRLVHT